MSSSKTITIDEDKFHRLQSFISTVEEKLFSMKNFYDKFYEMIGVVSQTHGTIFEELSTMKLILNQGEIKETNETTPKQLVNPILSRWQEKFDDDQSSLSFQSFQTKSLTSLSSKSLHSEPARNERSTDDEALNITATISQEFPMTNSSQNDIRPSSATHKRSSSLKKTTTQSSNRAKSPKSVSFSMDQEKSSPRSPIAEQTPTKEIQTTSIVKPASPRISSDLLPDLFQQHHHEVTTKTHIGYQMGNATSIVRIHEIDPINGEYLRLLNTSNNVDYDLSGHFLQQNVACVPTCRFRFPLNTIIRAGQSTTIYCGALKNVEAQPPDVLVWKEQKQWQLGPECVTILAKPNGQALAWTRSSHRIPVDPPAIEMFPTSVKAHIGTVDFNSSSTNSLRSNSRLSTSTFVGSIKGSHNNQFISTDYRTITQNKTGISQLLNRPKSSPFASHSGCKQDIISMNILKTKTIGADNEATVNI